MFSTLFLSLASGIALMPAVEAADTFREIPVLTQEIESEDDSVNAQFVVNSKLGRAWVVVTTSHGYGEWADESSARKLLPGLTYDKAAQAVVYEGVTCTKKPSIWRGRRLTKDCRFRVTTRTETVDNGFENVKKAFATVTLLVRAH